MRPLSTQPHSSGFLWTDYGRPAAGEYVHTISAADIAGRWWEGRAIAGRSQQRTQEGLEAIRQRLPFRIRMSRSRPYQKNHNAWMEYKNRTHVRRLVGYRRYDTMREPALLNQSYTVPPLGYIFQ